ncbi:Polyamine oxidase 7 [Linum perenne]
MFEESIREPESVLVPRWLSDRFYKGSYSNWPRGYSRERHRQPGANVGQVYFTGEHNGYEYYG